MTWVEKLLIAIAVIFAILLLVYVGWTIGTATDIANVREPATPKTQHHVVQVSRDVNATHTGKKSSLGNISMVSALASTTPHTRVVISPFATPSYNVIGADTLSQTTVRGATMGFNSINDTTAIQSMLEVDNVVTPYYGEHE